MCMYILYIGLSASSQSSDVQNSVAAANGMLNPISVQNLLTMAAMSHQQAQMSVGASTNQSLSAAAAAAAQLSNAAASSLCKYTKMFYIFFFALC